MRRAVLTAMLVLLVAGCGSDGDIGRRYRTERGLWQANWEFRNLAIRPQDVGDAQWAALARRYEGIAGKVARTTVDGEVADAREQMQVLAAQALFAAARIHGQLGDSTRAEEVFRRMAEDFSHLPQVSAEVALAQGNRAESRGRFLEAAASYQSVVDAITPRPGEAGAAGMVIDLPLRIAQLRAREERSPRGDMAKHLAPARAYYERLLAEHDEDLIQVESMDRLALVAANLRDWDNAIRHMRDLETHILAMDRPPRQPSEIRVAIARFQREAGAGHDEVRRTLESVLADYPGCDLMPQVLLALSENANERDEVEEALGYLDRIIREFRQDENAAPQALLIRGRLLAERDRWSEAEEIFRTLPAQYPLSEPALLAPLEIAGHYHRAGDTKATADALEHAESHYRDFIRRYPPGPFTLSARNRLIQTLLLMEKHDQAVDEYMSLGNDMQGSMRGIPMMISAARIARHALDDPLRAAEILDRLSEVHPDTDVGLWAAEEAALLRSGASD